MTSDGLAAGRQAVAAHFRAQAARILDDWRALIASDRELTAGDALPRHQLEDHLPNWLESFAAVLEAAPGTRGPSAAESHDAEVHGLQRWQQGYDLHDVMREWGYLHRCLVAELERCSAANPALPPAVLSEARMKLAEQISDATSTSAERYFYLERVEAAGSVRDLESALAEVRELEKKRGELWQQAAHDLRGNLGVVSNVAQGLNFQELPAQRRQDFLAMLRNNVRALHHLLDDVTSLARLQAGQEQRRIGEFDVAETLRRLADDLRPLADSKGLFLKAAGPDALPIEGDQVKVRRVAQNLLLNALNYTRSGGVTLTWDDLPTADGIRWRFTIEDTGPGFHAGPGALIANALDPAAPVGSTHGAPPPDAEVPLPGDTDPRPIRQAQGEGLGLAIVKRLCDLLDGSVEFDHAARQGTIVHVLLPRRYPTV